MTQKIETGSVWLANLNPNKGVEPGKVRPVLILQNQGLLNMGHPSTVIVPMTTQMDAANPDEDNYPLRVRIHAKDKLKQNSELLIDQVRAIDNVRLISPLTKITHKQLQTVYAAMREVIGMDD